MAHATVLVAAAGLRNNGASRTCETGAVEAEARGHWTPGPHRIDSTLVAFEVLVQISTGAGSTPFDARPWLLKQST